MEHPWFDPNQCLVLWYYLLRLSVSASTLGFGLCSFRFTRRMFGSWRSCQILGKLQYLLPIIDDEHGFPQKHRGA